jgi:hypothetical protein
MKSKPRLVLPAVLVAFLAGSMVVASVANALHPRPKSATPVQASLVPAYGQCTAPNRTHGPSLGFPSCNPPTQTSTAVTVGTPDANGAPANAAGYTRIRSLGCVPGPPDDCETDIKVNITDVRCQAGTTACGSANTSGGADYTGELQHSAILRMSDHFNAVAAGGGADPATVIDVDFPVTVPCAATASTSIGSTCSIYTFHNAVIPGSIKDGKRTVWEMHQVEVNDGGPDGAVGTAPNTLFAVQGVFIP